MRKQHRMLLGVIVVVAAAVFVTCALPLSACPVYSGPAHHGLRTDIRPPRTDSMTTAFHLQSLLLDRQTSPDHPAECLLGVISVPAGADPRDDRAKLLHNQGPIPSVFRVAGDRVPVTGPSEAVRGRCPMQSFRSSPDSREMPGVTCVCPMSQAFSLDLRV